MTITGVDRDARWQLVVGAGALAAGSYYGFRTVPTRSIAADTVYTLPLVLEVTGTGIPPMRRNIIPYGHLDGAFYQGGVYMPRVFFLKLLFVATSFTALQQDIAAWQGRLMPADRGAVTLRYTGDTQDLDIDALLEAGLEKSARQDAPGVRQEQLRFLAYVPFWRAAETVTATLDVRDSLANANNLLVRHTDGWVGYNANSVAYVTRYINGVLWAGGDFTTIGGSDMRRIAYYDEATDAWVEPGGGLNNIVQDLIGLPNGYILAVGNFTENATGTVTGLNGVALWNGSAWVDTYSPSTLGTAGTLFSVVLGYDGNIYAGGSMEGFDGSIDYVAKHNGSAWSQPGSAIDGTVNSLAAGLDGYIYGKGTFTGKAAYWDGSSWTTMGSITWASSRIHLGVDGAIYAIDGASGENIVRWNGSAWETVYEGSATLIMAGVLDNLDIWADGLSSNPVVYRHGVLSPAGWKLSAALTLYSVDDAGDGREAFGYSGAGTATTEGTTAVTYDGDTPARPTVTMTGPGEVYSLRNLITGKVIYFQGLTLLDGETATLDLEAGTFTSDWRGDILWAVDMASDFATFELMPGSNIIMMLIDNASAGAEMSWQCLYLGLESAD